MIKLQYTLFDLQNDATLKNAVDELVGLWANVEEEGNLTYGGEYHPVTWIYQYIIMYKCMIKMTDAQWAGQVFAWLGTGTFTDNLAENYTQPYSADGYTYAACDMTGRFYTGLELQIFVQNGCELMLISDYLNILPEFDDI